MITVRLFQLHVLQTELANPQLCLLAVLLRIRREIPSVDLVLTDLNLIDVLHLCDLCHNHTQKKCAVKTITELTNA